MRTMGAVNTMKTAVWVAVFAGISTAGGAGEFTDTRDGKTYKTVVIGGKAWMAQNLNYEPPSGTRRCYNNSPDSCNKYGRLYDWATAMDVNTCYKGNCSHAKHQGICPSGWHLPSYTEWHYLVEVTGGGKEEAGKKLKSTGGWKNYTSDGVTYSGNGTDEYGFSALPGGFFVGRRSDSRKDTANGVLVEHYWDAFFGAGISGYWWTANSQVALQSYDNADAYAYDLNIGKSAGAYLGTTRKSFGLSVRCVGD